MGRAVAIEPAESTGGGVSEGLRVSVGVALGLSERVGVAPAVGDAADVPLEQPRMAMARSRPPRLSPATCRKWPGAQLVAPDRWNLRCVGDWIIAGASLIDRGPGGRPLPGRL